MEKKQVQKLKLKKWAKKAAIRMVTKDRQSVTISNPINFLNGFLKMHRIDLFLFTGPKMNAKNYYVQRNLIK